MCLAVPMKIIELMNDDIGIVEADGTTFKVNLGLIEQPAEGDFVIIHAGFAIEKLDRQEADTRIELFKELAERQHEICR